MRASSARPEEWVSNLRSVLAACPGSFKEFIHAMGGPLNERPPHQADHTLFPLPWISASAAPLTSRGDDKLVLANLWIGCLNWLALGDEWTICRWKASAAQRRMLDNVRECARHLLAQDLGGELGPEEFTKFLREELCYGGHLGALPLGTRAGVPERAATVETADVLRKSRPDLARIVEDPEALLVPEDRWPNLPERAFTLVDSSYPALIRAAVDSGLQEWVPEGPPCRGGREVDVGGFAVPKDLKEDRWISPCKFINARVDLEKLPKVELPFLPQLASLSLDPKRDIRVYKRDARHYFHMLKSGRAWRRWFCQPAVRLGGRRLTAAHRAWAMGFRGSAAIAQGVTDAAALEAGLPGDRRCLPGVRMAERPPVWGSIMDDVWVITQNGEDPIDEEATHWAQGVEDAWDRVGVPSHPLKRVEAAQGEEIQGAYLDAATGTLGLSAAKARLLSEGVLRGALRWRPARYVLQRLLGKLGHAHMFCVLQRSIFQEAHAVVHRAWGLLGSQGWLLPLGGWWSSPWPPRCCRWRSCGSRRRGAR